MRTVNIYTFDELTSEARQKAIIDWIDKYSDFDWHEDYMKSLYAFADFIGIKITNYMFSLDGLSYINWEFIEDGLRVKVPIPSSDGLTGFRADYTLLDTWNKNCQSTVILAWTNPETHIVSTCLEAFKRDYLRDWEDMLSNDRIAETLSINGYEFLLDGTMISKNT